MRLLVVAPYFYPKIGGMENYAWNISKGLKEKYGWDVVVITSNHAEKKLKIENINGIKIYRLPTLFKISNTPINPLWVFKIKQIIKSEKPDVINAHSPVPFIADVARIVSGKIPFIFTYHAGSMLKGKFIPDLLIRIYEYIFLKALFRSSDAIISYSSQFINTSLNEFKNKVYSINPAVDTSLFKPKKVLNKDNEVLFVGRIEKSSEWKGIRYLIDAISMVRQSLPHVKLNIVGDGDSLKDLKKYVKNKNLRDNIKFQGALKGKALVSQYQNSSLLVLPSVTNAESFGIVLIEAMACGLPVIGSKIGGIPGVIDHNKTGLIVEPGNSKAIADAVIKLLTNKLLTKRLGQTGYKKVKLNYSIDNMLSKYNKIIYAKIK